MNWLTSDEDLISIRPKEPEDRRLHVTGNAHPRSVPDERDLPAADRDLLGRFGLVEAEIAAMAMKTGRTFHRGRRSRRARRARRGGRTSIPTADASIEDSRRAETDFGRSEADRRHPDCEGRLRPDRARRNWPTPGRSRNPTPMPADQDAVNMLTGTSRHAQCRPPDRRTSGEPERVRPDNSAEEVDVTLKGGKTTKLLLGSDTPAGTGTYAKLESDPKVYTVAHLHQDQLRQDRQRSARQAAADIQSGQADVGRVDRQRARPSSSARTPRATGRSRSRSRCAPTACRWTT